MAMAEVQYALRDVAEYFVGSQEVVSGDGYDYRTLFQSLSRSPTHQWGSLAGGMVQSYEAATAGQDGGWDTQSAIITGEMLNLIATLKSFTDSTIGLTSAQLTTIARAIEASIAYSDPEFRDLGSIMSAISMSADLPDSVLLAGNAVLGSLSVSLATLATDSPLEFRHLHLYTELGQVSQEYRDEYSSFMSATGWIDMLERIGPISSAAQLQVGDSVPLRPFAIGLKAMTLSPMLPICMC